MNLLILGTILSSDAFAYNVAANPASTKWLKGFASGLIENHIRVELAGHCYSRCWPNGPIFPGKKEYLDNSFQNSFVRFINLPGVRFASMAFSYWKVADELIKDSGCDAIVTYNPYPWHVSAARKIRRKYKIPWICLNLDFDNVGDNWASFTKQAGDADGHLFLFRIGVMKKHPLRIRFILIREWIH